MSRRFNRKERRIIGSFTRHMRRFWTRVREEIGDDKVDAWYLTGDISYLGEQARSLIDTLQAHTLRMEKARR